MIYIPKKFKFLVTDDIQARFDDVKTMISASEKLSQLIISMNNYSDALSEHAFNVTILSMVLGERLNLTPSQLIDLGIGSIFHDIGKIHLPKAVLYKPEQLTHDEYAIIMEHPGIGHRLVQNSGISELSLSVILLHHYSVGYPAYPTPNYIVTDSVHIVTLADCFDAMTSERPYQKPRSFTDAMDEVNRCSGSQFRTSIVELFNILFQDGFRHAC